MRVLSSNLHLSFAEGESAPEDDIDRLFGKLRPLEPPGDIMKQILARVKRFPAPQPLPRPERKPEDRPREAAE